MKKLLALSAVAVILFSCNNNADKGKFTLWGELKALPDQKIYLEQLYFSAKQPEVLDTGEIKAGKFTLSAVAAEEGLFRIRTEEGASAIFINEESKINFAGTAVSQEPLNGSFSGAANSSLKKLSHYMDSTGMLISNKNRLIEEFTKAGAKPTDSIFMAVTNDLSLLTDNFSKFSFAYADTAKSPVVALFAATLAPVDISKFEAPLAKLVKRFPDHKGIADALAYVKTQAAQPQTKTQPASKPSVGDMAPELTMNDVDDKPFSLSQLRGKYVLIDFWASWCGPCRGENPNVVAAFNQYKNKNFTVLGVSLDKNKQAWIDAIKEDKLNWQHISDLKYWSSAATSLYGFDGIPYNVLIDPQGKIIATDLRESALQNKLAEVLK
ncbi:MAG: AhpC/TSA family protein [Chitinophagaceae bacterium]|nr:AhpC/TSA family protein [Chitinophagaceae bacterium]